jgi:hypothetical protein
MKKYNTEQERIISRIVIDENGCWLWCGTSKNKNGKFNYGRLTVGSRTDGKRKNVSAHRYSYSVFTADIPDGLNVCHTCDVPRCVNPAHLFLGTRQDNVDDRQKKGRNNPTRGEQQYNSVLTDSQVLTIRIMHLNGIKRKNIQALTGIKIHLIKDILTYRSWKHILPSPPLNNQ